MSLNWRNEDIGSFFGNDEREILEYKPGSKLFIVDYAGKLLRYSFWFHITDECVMVSGNDGTPFVADSLYEIVVPCIRRLPSHARSPSRSCLHLVLVLLKLSFGILIS